MKIKYHYTFNIEIALKGNDTHIYAFNNVSFIPTQKLVEIFKINTEKDPHILEGYFLTKSQYQRHRKYIDGNFGPINLKVFEYCLRVYRMDSKKEIRKFYKESLFE